MWTLNEAAERTRTSRSTLQRLASSGLIIGAYKQGRAWHVPMSGLIAAGLKVSEDTTATGRQREIEQQIEVQRARDEATRWRMKAEALERELTRADGHLADMRRALAVLELNAAPQDRSDKLVGDIDDLALVRHETPRVNDDLTPARRGRAHRLRARIHRWTGER